MVHHQHVALLVGELVERGLACDAPKNHVPTGCGNGDQIGV